jgi:DNA primase
MSYDLTSVDTLEFLESLDIENISADDEEIRFSCPYPDHRFGDKNPSAYMNVETTAWTCFGCGAKGNAISFLAYVRNVSRVQAAKWIAEKWLPQYADIDNMTEFIRQLLEHNERKATEENCAPPKSVVLPSDVLVGKTVNWAMMDEAEIIPGWGAYMLDNRGFTAETLEKFGFAYDPIMDRPCIVARDPDGNVVGFKGRAWRDDQWPKYLVAGDTSRSIAQHGERYGFAPYDAQLVVYGLDVAEIKDGHLTLVEGEFNTVAMHQKGFTDSVGISGSSMSQTQIDQIVERCDHVTIFMDSDLGDDVKEATAMRKLFQVVDAFEKYLKVTVVPLHKGDAADMDKTYLHELMDRKVSSSLFRLITPRHEPWYTDDALEVA